MVAKRTVYVPNWLTKTGRDKIAGDAKYNANLKKAVREVALALWLQKGGKDPLYMRLREAYFGGEQNRAEQ